MNNVTANKNYLAPTGFKITIDSTKFANLEYFCIQLTHPSISLGGASLPFRGSTNFVPGDRIEYGTLDMRFQVSEYMENYIELFNWLNRNHDDGGISEKADVVLSILDSSNNASKKIRYVDAFPVSIGSIDFHTQNTDVEYVTVDASLQYSYFEFL
jgi:hypothetical protein